MTSRILPGALVALVAVVAAGMVALNLGIRHPAASEVITRTHVVYLDRTITRTVTRWKTRTVTSTATVDTGIPVTCGQELWQAWANRAPVAASMMNVAPSTVPACMPYLSQIDGN